MLGKLRRPDDVEPIDVDVAGLGGEPQLVLAELIGRRSRHVDDLDLVAGLRLEDVELLAQVLLVAPDGAVDDRQIDREGR